MSDTTHTTDWNPQKSDFVAMVSHELRTPLTAIQATVKLMAEGFLGETSTDQKQALSMTLVNLERMGRLLNNLLDLSKAEAGRLELCRERVEFVGLLREITKTFEPLARERGLTLRADVPQIQLPLYVDKDKIMQVFTNLIHNALKFTSHGSVELSLRTQGDYIECRVTDTGVGIPDKEIPLVFSKFPRLSPRSFTAEQGTGLGLSLSKNLVELHGGSIQVESRPAKGTTFTILLPKMTAEAFFREEALKLFAEAQATSRPLSFVRVFLKSWEDVEKSLGAETAATILNHFEMLVKTSLREERDVAIQTPSGFWLALPLVERAKADEIAARIQLSLKNDTLRQQMKISIEVETRVTNYPDDISYVDKLLAYVS